MNLRRLFPLRITTALRIYCTHPLDRRGGCVQYRSLTRRGYFAKCGVCGAYLPC